MKKQRASQLVRDTAPWTLAGLAVMLTSGPLIFSSDPNLYMRNPSFQFKIVALLVAILFNYMVRNRVALSDPSAGLGFAVGAVSLALWISVVAGGLFIAFV